jgi:hypothetical protein
MGEQIWSCEMSSVASIKQHFLKHNNHMLNLGGRDG